MYLHFGCKNVTIHKNSPQDCTHSFNGDYFKGLHIFQVKSSL